MTKAGVLDQKQIMEIIPHRPPFLFVDEILELVPGERAIGIYTVKERDCEGHFLGRPIMPGVLIQEVMNQVGAVAILSLPENQGKIAKTVGGDGLRYRKEVHPGDTIRAEVTKIREGKINVAKAVAYVDGVLVAEFQILCIVENKKI